jgi:iron complex transport system ATP-binding protein
LDHLSLDIRQGDHTAILGSNGSGKSSLIKLITQEYRAMTQPTHEPPVRIFGRDRWDVFELRGKLGIISADLHHRFVEAANARGILGLQMVVSGFFASLGVRPYHEVTQRMWERGRDALALMDSSHLADKPVEEMSTGEARRVLIARALVSDPSALLLDEPTAGLDVVARHRFLEAVRRLARSGTTIIFVTHHVHDIIPEVQRVVLLRKGKVYVDGPKEKILTAGSLSAAFDAPLQIELTATGFYSTLLLGSSDGHEVEG